MRLAIVAAVVICALNFCPDADGQKLNLKSLLPFTKSQSVVEPIRLTDQPEKSSMFHWSDTQRSSFPATGPFRTNFQRMGKLWQSNPRPLIQFSAFKSADQQRQVPLMPPRNSLLPDTVRPGVRQAQQSVPRPTHRF